MNMSADRDGVGMRHDSLGVPGSLGVPRTAARPISTGGARRGSNTAGSFMGGMSFGGISMNSWVQDESVPDDSTKPAKTLLTLIVS